MKRLLIIAYDFPPNGITSSRRPGGMAKYLPEFGWEPVVVTRRWTADNCNFDSTIVPNLPADLSRHEIDAAPANAPAAERVAAQMVRFARPELHPYDFLKAGRREIDRALRLRPVEAIWATAPPSNVLELARYAAESSGRPWVADFRDVWQWVPNAFTRMTLPLRLRHERRVLAGAAAVTAVSEGFAEILRRRHGRGVQLISHGFDPDLAPKAYPARFPKFNLVYTGGVVLGRPDLRPLLEAMGRLIDRGEMQESDVALEFFGKGNAARLREMFAGHRYAHLVSDHGAVPREEVIERQRCAALLLIASHPGSPGWVTSKLFEYLVAGRPILAIPRDRDCIDDMLRETRTGTSCSTVEEIERQLCAHYGEWRRSGSVAFQGLPEVIGRYSNRSQAGELARLLDAVTEKRS